LGGVRASYAQEREKQVWLENHDRLMKTKEEGKEVKKMGVVNTDYPRRWNVWKNLETMEWTEFIQQPVFYKGFIARR
jgi:hypothetical protein